jgi:putative inorganic carbon (HCO3(-)) transporter
MRDVLLAALVFGLLPVCFARPWIGVLVWYWIGMMSPQWFMWGFARDFRWAAVVGGVTLAGLLFTRDRKPIPWNAQLVLMVLILAYFTFTTFFAWVPDAAWEKWGLVAKVILMTLITTMAIYGRKRIGWLLAVISLSVGFYGIKGGMWSLFVSGGEYSVRGPEGGFMTMNNGIGIGLLMVLPVLLALAREHAAAWQRWSFRLAAGLCAVSIVFTYSRGALLGLAASMLIMFLRSERKFLAVLAIVPVIVVASFWVPEKLFDRAETISTYDKDNSVLQRFQAWTVAWNIALESPITGGGFDFDSTSDTRRWFSYGAPDIYQTMDLVQSAHSIYFQILGQHGFVALGLYLLLMISTLWNCNRLVTRAVNDPKGRWIANYASAIQISLVGYMVSGAFVSTAYFDLAWIYYAFTAILGRELTQRDGASYEATLSREQARLDRVPVQVGQNL